MSRLRVALDFDGVLNTYDGWNGEHDLFYPRQGVGLFLAKLDEKYDVIIFTLRKPHLVWSWLIEYRLAEYITDVTNVKPKAFVYVDDRACKFEGDYDETLNIIDTFTTHWEPNSVEFVDSD